MARGGAGRRRGGGASDERNASRLFVGNLAVEGTATEHELAGIFAKYGHVSEVELHRNFGFVQLDSPDAVQRAVAGEQGRIVGGRPVNLRPADKRGEKTLGGGPGSRDGPGPRDGPGSHDGPGRDRKRGRDDFRDGYYDPANPSWYPEPSAKHPRMGPPGPPGPSGPPAPGMPPSPVDGFVVKVLLLGGGQRAYSEVVVAEVAKTYVPFKFEMLDGRNLGQALRDCEDNLSRYAVVIGRENAAKRTVSLKMLYLKDPRRPQCPTFDATLPEMVDRIIQAERKLGFHAAGVPPPEGVSPPHSIGVPPQDPSAPSSDPYAKPASNWNSSYPSSSSGGPYAGPGTYPPPPGGGGAGGGDPYGLPPADRYGSGKPEHVGRSADPYAVPGASRYGSGYDSYGDRGPSGAGSYPPAYGQPTNGHGGAPGRYPTPPPSGPSYGSGGPDHRHDHGPPSSHGSSYPSYSRPPAGDYGDAAHRGPPLASNSSYGGSSRPYGDDSDRYPRGQESASYPLPPSSGLPASSPSPSGGINLSKGQVMNLKNLLDSVKAKSKT